MVRFKLLVIIFWTLGAMLAYAGDTSEYRSVRNFTVVKLAGSSSLSIAEGSDFSVKLTGPAELLQKAETLVKGDTLMLSVKERGWFSSVSADKVHFDVTMPRINGVILAGAGDANVGAVATEDINLSLTGAGDIRVESLTAKSLSMTVTGSGNMRIDHLEVIEAEATIMGSGDIAVAGEVHTQKVNVMGSGNFQGDKLSVQVAEGAIMGSGDIELGRAAKHAIRVMGSGDVRVKAER